MVTIWGLQFAMGTGPGLAGGGWLLVAHLGSAPLGSRQVGLCCIQEGPAPSAISWHTGLPGATWLSGQWGWSVSRLGSHQVQRLGGQGWREGACLLCI